MKSHKIGSHIFFDVCGRWYPWKSNTISVKKKNVFQREEILQFLRFYFCCWCLMLFMKLRSCWMQTVFKVQKTTKKFRKTPDSSRILQQNTNRVTIETDYRAVFVYIQILNKTNKCVNNFTKFLISRKNSPFQILSPTASWSSSTPSTLASSRPSPSSPPWPPARWKSTHSVETYELFYFSSDFTWNQQIQFRSSNCYFDIFSHSKIWVQEKFLNFHTVGSSILLVLEKSSRLSVVFIWPRRSECLRSCCLTNNVFAIGKSGNNWRRPSEGPTRMATDAWAWTKFTAFIRITASRSHVRKFRKLWTPLIRTALDFSPKKNLLIAKPLET